MSNVNNVGNGNGNVAEAQAAAEKAAERAAERAEKAAERAARTDKVEVSKKGLELAAAAKADTTSKVVVTPQEATTAEISDPKVEKANKKVTAAEKSQDQRKNARQAMRENRQELRKLVKGLKKLGMGSRQVSKIVKNANRKANKVVAKEIKQAYNDVRSHKINKQSFYNKLYGAAVKKLDGLVSALRDAYEQKLASSQSEPVAVKPIETMDPPEPVKKADEAEDKNAEAVKETANETKSDETTKPAAETKVTDADDASKANAEKGEEAAKESANATKSDETSGANKETKVTDADDAAKANAEKSAEAAKENANKTSEKEVKTENGNTVKAEKTKETKTAEEGGNGKALGKGNGILGSGAKPINGKGNEGNAFGQLVNFFSDIDKMINGFADKAEGKGGDKGDSLLNFADRLSDMFSGINKAFGRGSNDNVGHKLGMAQVKKETAGQLFNSDGHGSGAINRIGDAGEGSGNFNAVSFMSSLSNGINEGLESYKDVQKAEKESKEEPTKEEAVSAVA